MRQKIKIKRGLVGSSDVSKLKARKACLELAHKEFVSSELHSALMAVSVTPKEPQPDELVAVKVFGKWITMPYGTVKSAQFKCWERTY